jgi:hypothetical protein
VCNAHNIKEVEIFGVVKISKQKPYILTSWLCQSYVIYVFHSVCHALVFHLTGVNVFCYADFHIIRL